MKKIILLALAGLMVLGAATAAFAASDDDVSQMLTEGKILATMALSRDQVVTKLQETSKEIYKMQEVIAMMEEEGTQVPAGRLSALGQIDTLVHDLIIRAKNTGSDDMANLEAIAQQGEELRQQASRIFSGTEQ